MRCGWEKRGVGMLLGKGSGVGEGLVGWGLGGCSMVCGG